MFSDLTPEDATVARESLTAAIANLNPATAPLHGISADRFEAFQRVSDAPVHKP
jgi:hypothetical protein